MLPNTTPQLTDEQKSNLEAARLLIPKVREQLRLARQAGIDVTDQEKALEEQSKSLDRLYRTYINVIGTTKIP